MSSKRPGLDWRRLLCIYEDMSSNDSQLIVALDQQGRSADACDVAVAVIDDLLCGSRFRSLSAFLMGMPWDQLSSMLVTSLVCAAAPGRKRIAAWPVVYKAALARVTVVRGAEVATKILGAFG